MRRVSGAGVVAGVLALMVAVTASATTLSVDTGRTGQQVAAGFEEFSGTGGGTKSMTYASALGNAGTVTVVTQQPSGEDWRTRSAGHHPIGDVIEDIAFTHSTMTVSLQNLQAGSYALRSYHHDTQYPFGTIDVALTDATRTSRLMVDDLTQTTGTTPGVVATVPLVAQADGSGDVVLHLSAPYVGVISGLEITDSPPAELKVDIGAPGANNDVQAGFQSFAMLNSNGSATGGSISSPQEHWFFTEAGNAGSVRVNLSNPDNSGSGLAFRDRGDVTHALGDLAEDFVFNNGGERLDLTLGSLKPGRYFMTAYLHDRLGAFPGTADVRVSDVLGAERLAVGGVASTSGSSPADVASATFSFTSNGVDPVVIHFDEGTAEIVTLNGFSTTADGALRVDFASSTQDSSTGHDVQNGFLAFARSASTTSGTQSETFASVLGTSGTVTAKVSAADGSLAWRDRGDLLGGELGDVGEDFVFDTNYIDLVLEGLKADWYLMTSYHHDMLHVASDLDIFVSDARGDDLLVVQGLTQTVAGTGDPALASFKFLADGVNPVTIRFDNTGTGSTIARLNGFSVTPTVPEPATLSLLALGGLAAWVRKRKQR